MCGISGLVNCGDGETLARMTNVQTHRGPDDSGLWEQRFPDGSYVGLGSRRLAILDLSSNGRMPMCNDDRTVWITYNGEIYNFRSLREELAGKGHRFYSNTDTEVVLRLYEQYGPDCVSRLNGIFAFAICDLRSWMARSTARPAPDCLQNAAVYMVARRERPGLRRPTTFPQNLSSLRRSGLRAGRRTRSKTARQLLSKQPDAGDEPRS